MRLRLPWLVANMDLYCRAHLDSSVGLGGDGGVNDAYLFGARIEKASPHERTANNGYFNATDGFVVAGQNDYVGYPAASSVDPVNPPTSAQVSGVSLNFQSTAKPDFI